MIAADRRFAIIALLFHRHGFVKVQEMSDRFAASGSTIRADIDYLHEHFTIESRTGKYGGYRLTDAPIFFLHAEMLHKVRHGIEKIGGLDGYDADLMEQSIRVLQSIKKKDCCYSL